MAQLSSYEQFIEEAKSRVDEAAEGASCFFVMYLDIAGFQLVNDFYGVEEGNRFLLALETFLQEEPDARLCRRVFSDHYLCLFQVERQEELSTFGEEMLKRLRGFRDAQRVYHKSCNLHIIGGLCQIKDGSKGVMAAIDNANIARKKAKDTVGTDLLWFDDDMQEQIAHVKQLEVDIQDALANDEFTFFLQPKVNLRSGKIVGTEALARWMKADGEQVSPASFIPFMERNETILELDYRIYKKVCKFLKAQLERGEKPVPVSVNMSRLHTHYPDTAERIHHLVCQYQIPPYLLEFELTESMLMQDFTVAKQIMSQLRSYGYKTSIDDYGSGYSGIMTFQELDFDVLKLDRSFLDEEDGKYARNDAIVKRIVMLSEDFQTAVLSEGVETAEQCERMKDLGCQIVQGYYFSRPLPADKFLEFWKAGNGYCQLPWKTETNLLSFAPEHVDLEYLPEAQVRSITQSFFHTLPCGIAGFSDKERILFATPEYFTLIGYTRDELRGCSREEIAQYLDAEFLEPYDAQAIKEKLDKNQNIHLQFYATRKDGKRIFVSLYVGRASSPEWGSYVLGAFFDETERKSNEEQVNEYREQIKVERERADQRLATTMEMMGACISEYDFDTGTLYIPRQGCRLSEVLLDRKEISQDDFISLGMVREDYREAYLDIFSQMRDKDTVYLEFPYQIRPGEYHWISLNARVAVREEGRPIRSIGVYRLIENKPEVPKQKETEKEKQENHFSGLLKKVCRPDKIMVLLIAAVVSFSVFIDVEFVRFRRSLRQEFMQFSQDNLLNEHIDAIMRNILSISIILIVFCCGLGLLAFYGYIRYKRRIQLENERYAMLAAFSDTILFQYFYGTDTLVLTPNAKDRFLVKTLRKKKYLKEDKSVFHLGSGDWLLIKEAFGHPGDPNETKTIRIRVMGKNHTYLWCSLQMRFLYRDDRADAVVGKITDISRQKEREEELVQQAQIDGLTHVYNKFAAEQRISEQIGCGVSGTLFMMDMDNFKKINDEYGHTKGDEALESLGKLLGEVFGEENIVGRIGGDEFVAYVADDSAGESPQRRAQMILDGLEKESKKDATDITLSIGMASYPRDGSCYQDIYHAADQAMYEAKKLGKNRYYQRQDGE